VQERKTAFEEVRSETIIETIFVAIVGIDDRNTHMDTQQLADAFATKFMEAVRAEDNLRRLRELQAMLPRCLLPSFESLLSRYSFASFDASGISFFGWGPTSAEFF
jgi:hypothetical protein